MRAPARRARDLIRVHLPPSQGRATYDPGLKAGPTSPYAYLTQYAASRTLMSPDPAVTVVDDRVGPRAFDSGFAITHFAKVLS